MSSTNKQALQIHYDNSWNFSNLSRKQTNYASHGYHKYPAKFIPQIVDRLLDSYSREGDTVLDPFGGCGTTLVESKIKKRNSIVIDINQVALMISSTKKTAINPHLLLKKNEELIERISRIKIKKNYYRNAHSRLKYWFKKDQYNLLMGLFNEIQKENAKKIKIFYNCCFSNILKNCSIWYSKSIKPMRDLTKKEVDPIETFLNHLKFMTNQNEEYYGLVRNSKTKIHSKVLRADSRSTGLQNKSIDLIITSPPYATSYEYADLHQLSLLWFGFTNDICSAREDFIGSSARRSREGDFGSKEITNMLKRLRLRNKGLSEQITSYFLDMEDSFREMYRVLKKGKRLCLIMGDTEYKGVKIRNTEISIEILRKIGFKIERVIKRKLSSKIFTPFRDETGRFTNSANAKKRRIYQYEYIVIARK